MPTRLRSAVVLTAFAATAAITLTACGGGSSGSASSATPSSGVTASPAAGSSSGSGTGTGGARGPAASGLIAAVTGTTMQVQNQQDGQVAVSWSASTKFTQQVTVAASSIKAGDCVTAIATSGSSSTATSFTATTVAVSQPVNGSCTGGFGGGTRPSGGNFPTGTRPSNFPDRTNRPSGFPSGGTQTQIAIATGSVVSVSGWTLVVASRDFGFGRGAGSGSSPAASPTTTDKTVTVAATTKITSVQAATATAVQVGKCATAEGTADSSGAVSATSIAITDAVNGECTTTGFGGFGRGGFGGGGGAGGAGGAGGSGSGGSGGTGG